MQATGLPIGKFSAGDVVYGGQCAFSMRHCETNHTYYERRLGKPGNAMTMFIVAQGPDAESGVAEYFRDNWVGKPGVQVVGGVKDGTELVKHVPYFGQNVTNFPQAIVQRQSVPRKD